MTYPILKPSIDLAAIIRGSIKLVWQELWNIPREFEGSKPLPPCRHSSLVKTFCAKWRRCRARAAIHHKDGSGRDWEKSCRAAVNKLAIVLLCRRSEDALGFFAQRIHGMLGLVLATATNVTLVRD